MVTETLPPAPVTMQPLVQGGSELRLAGPRDMAAVMALRAAQFRGGQGDDADGFDARFNHLLLTDQGRAMATLRFAVQDAAGLAQGYCAQFFDLSPRPHRRGPFLEIGRLCIDPDCRDPAAMRMIWAGLAQVVDGAGVAMMVGCTSLRGAGHHGDVLAYLAHHHLAPPQITAPARGPHLDLAAGPHDPATALRAMPPLLRSYLAMGGVVADQAALDADLDTTVLLTLVDIAAIPPARARALRALSG